jgi:hypothetical protein
LNSKDRVEKSSCEGGDKDHSPIPAGHVPVWKMRKERRAEKNGMEDQPERR